MYPEERDTLCFVAALISVLSEMRVNACFYFPCHHPPGQPPDGSGDGKLVLAVLSRGEWGGANRKQRFVVLGKYVTTRLTR